MHLGNRSGGHRVALEMRKQLVRMRAQGLGDLRDRQVGVERRHPILQVGQFFGDIGRHQVAPGRQHLAEFDKNRAQLFQRQAQAHAARRRQVAPEDDGVDQLGGTRHFQAGDGDFIKTVFDGYPDDF